MERKIQRLMEEPRKRSSEQESEERTSKKMVLPPHLPPDLTLNIFSRLPTKFLHGLRRNWPDKSMKQLLYSPYFVKMHTFNMMKEPVPKQLIVQHCTNALGVLDVCNLGEPSLEPTIELPREGYDHNLGSLAVECSPKYCQYSATSYSVIGSCNGLVCLDLTYSKRVMGTLSMHYPGGKVRIFVIWNPVTREYHKLPPPTELSLAEHRDEKFGYNEARLGFGYDVASDSYKVIIGEGSDTEWYDLSTDSWQIIKNNVVWKDIDDDFCNFDHIGYFFNGAIHWVVAHDKIVAFNLGTKACRHISPPRCCSEVCAARRHSLDLGAVEGCLAITCNQKYKFDVWVLKEYEREESWTKKMSIAHDWQHWEVRPPLWVSEEKSLMLIRAEDEELGFYNYKEKKLGDNVGCPGLDFLQQVIPHVDTLLSPKPKIKKMKKIARLQT